MALAERATDRERTVYGGRGVGAGVAVVSGGVDGGGVDGAGVDGRGVTVMLGDGLPEAVGLVPGLAETLGEADGVGDGEGHGAPLDSMRDHGSRP